MKTLGRNLLILLAAACLGSIQAQDLGGATNQTITPLPELHVRLQEANYISTVRGSAGYKFAIQGKRLPDQRDSLSIRLFEGSDVDDQGRDSIQRLNAFFGATRTNSVPEGPMTIQNTNRVTVKIFKCGWLFRDEGGRTVAIGRTNAREWMSKQILEEFGSANGGHPILSETNSISEKRVKP